MQKRTAAVMLAVLLISVLLSACNTQKTHVVDKTQHSWILEPTYSSVYIGQMMTSNTGIFDGLLAVSVMDEAGIARSGYVSENGGFAIDPNFGQIDRFSNGYAAAMPLQGDAMYGVIDSKGNFTSEKEFGRIGYFGAEGIAPASLSGTDKYGYINKDGKFAIVPAFILANPFSDGFGLVAQGNDKNEDIEYFFIDKNSKILGDKKYILAQSFSEGLAAVWTGESFEDTLAGFIDTAGELVIEAKFKAVGSFSNGLAPAVAADGELYGFIDKTGKFVIEPQFIYTTGFCEGLAMVDVRNEAGETVEGYIDTAGKFVIEPIYYSCQNFRGGYASAATKAQHESGTGNKIIFDKTGKIVVGEDLKISDGAIITSVCYGNAVIAKKDGKYGVIRLADVK